VKIQIQFFILKLFFFSLFVGPRRTPWSSRSSRIPRCQGNDIKCNRCGGSNVVCQSWSSVASVRQGGLPPPLNVLQSLILESFKSKENWDKVIKYRTKLNFLSIIALNNLLLREGQKHTPTLFSIVRLHEFLLPSQLPKRIKSWPRHWWSSNVDAFITVLIPKSL
jgi:hypothetical protein